VIGNETDMKPIKYNSVKHSNRKGAQKFTRIELRRVGVGTTASYSEVPGFESRPRDRLS